MIPFTEKQENENACGLCSKQMEKIVSTNFCCSCLKIVIQMERKKFAKRKEEFEDTFVTQSKRIRIDKKPISIMEYSFL